MAVNAREEMGRNDSRLINSNQIKPTENQSRQATDARLCLRSFAKRGSDGDLDMMQEVPE
jgi:hypothetical protein